LVPGTKKLVIYPKIPIESIKNPKEFLESISKTVDDKAAIITEKIYKIECVMAEIANILIVAQQTSTSKDTTTQRRANKTGKMTFKELCDVEPKLKELQGYYSSFLFDAIHVTIRKSLKLLATACGYKPNDLLKHHLNNNNSNDDDYDILNSLQEKSTTLTNTTTTMGASENLSRFDITTERPMSGASSVQLSTATWSNVPQFETAYLK
jgi:hypothetical protein